VKSRTPASTHKRVVVVLFDRSAVKGYLNPALLGRTEAIEMLTMDGEHKSVPLAEAKSVYFVREFSEPFVVVSARK